MKEFTYSLAQQAIEAQKHEEILDKPRPVDSNFLANPENLRLEMFVVMREAFNPFLRMPSEDVTKLVSDILSKEEMFSDKSIKSLSFVQREKFLSEFCHLVVSRVQFRPENLRAIMREVFDEEIKGKEAPRETCSN